jgi:hypothetical protein
MNPERVAIRSSGWLDGGPGFTVRVEQNCSGKDGASVSWKRMNQNWEKDATPKCAFPAGDSRDRVELTSMIPLSVFFLGARTTI